MDHFSPVVAAEDQLVLKEVDICSLIASLHSATRFDDSSSLHRLLTVGPLSNPSNHPWISLPGSLAMAPAHQILSRRSR